MIRPPARVRSSLRSLQPARNVVSFRIKLGSFSTGVVEAHDGEGTHGDHTDDEDICKLAEEAACGVRRTAPLHAQTIQTDHAVKFSDDEEQEEGSAQKAEQNAHGNLIGGKEHPA